MAEIPIATAVGWVVSPVIKLVMDKTQTYTGNKLFEKWGIESEMKKMKMRLREILCIMGTVEKQSIENPNQVELVQEIKDAVYEAEDVIDEFEYNLLEEKSREQNNIVIQVASSSCCVVKKFTDLKFKKKVEAVIKHLDQAKESANTLHGLIKDNASSSKDIHLSNLENDIVTSSIIIDKVIGRQSERTELMDLLFNQVDKLPTVIPIVGQGGMGKTTLAQMIFNDPRVHDHFNRRVWLSVSDNFDKIRLTKQMVKHVSENLSTEDMSFDMLQNKLEKEFEGKKILLVLDDVWYNKDDKEKYSYKKQWKQLLAPLLKADVGSKIILTTREDIVGGILGTVPSMTLNGLNADDSWLLFKLCVFDGDDNNGRQDLKLIGKEIVKKLKGLALAIKVVGTQLRGNQEIQEWERTLCDDMLDTRDIMNILYRSYEHLPEHLRRCFAYCSLFPKDYHFNTDRLIHMWIAQGLVHSKERENLEDVGKSYFKGLLARSFFEVIKRGSKKYYVMHDLMNDLACHVSKGECYRLDKYDSIKNLGSIRHLSITYEAINILMSIRGLNKLRTLIFLGPRWRSNVDIKNLISLKRIRVLEIEFMLSNISDIGECKHLRYLSLRSKPNYLPDCFRKLHHLNALFVRKGPTMLSPDISKVILPKFLCGMSTLLFIDISKLICVDVGEQVEQKFLTLLRGGSAYHCIKKNNGYGLDLLGDLNNIKGQLWIDGLENVTIREEAIKAQLGKKERVTNLILKWEHCPRPLEIESSECRKVLEALVPSHNLESLDLRGYKGSACPSWLESNLLSLVKSIYLSGCTEIKMLPSLGQLPLLQKLYMQHLISVRRICDEFYGKGTFPSLEYLEIERLDSLEECCYPCDMPVFPKLHKLKISSCNKLIRLEGLDQLVSLQGFYIRDCSNLFSLPEMEHFYSLKFLAIFNCPKLSLLPRNGLPVSLRLLCIGETMHRSLEYQIRNKKGREWDKLAAISLCHLCAAFVNQEDFEDLSTKSWRIFYSDSFMEDNCGYWKSIQKFEVKKMLTQNIPRSEE